MSESDRKRPSPRKPNPRAFGKPAGSRRRMAGQAYGRPAPGLMASAIWKACATARR